MVISDNDPSVESLLATEDIDYSALGNRALFALSTQHSDPWIATPALGELAQRSPVDTTAAAKQILDAALWDAHLSAYALNLLYDEDADAALDRMKIMITTEGDNPTILEAMLKNVLSDVTRFEDPLLGALISEIAHRVLSADRNLFSHAEFCDRFLERYPLTKP